ncbi:MAG: MFS transporter [Chloroflexi bacterium]|nr:MFS transporter [Chloroflexota bacterium]
MAEPTENPKLKDPPKIFYGWWIVAISVVADGLKHGSFNRGFTIYVNPIRNELGLGVAAIALADMLGRLLGGFQGPLVGYLTDRWGPRVMLAFGAIMSGLGFILLTFTHNYAFFLFVFVGFLSLGFRSGYNNASIAAVNQWFRRKRSLAMSIVSVGNGLGGAFAPLVALLVITVGWRPAVFISGVIIIAVIGPLSLLMRGAPESMGLLPDGDKPEQSDSAESQPGSAVDPARVRRVYRDMDFTAKEAMRTPTYWLIVLAVGLRNTVHSGISFLLAPVMVWFLQGGGRDEKESLLIASFFVMALAFSSIIFNPSVGWLGDKVSKQRLSAVCMISGALALLTLLNHSGNLWQLFLFAVLLALSESANPLAWAIMGDAFGRRSFATIRGWQHLPDQLMSMSTPVWMGIIFDRTESYFWALVPLVIIYLLASVGYWIIPRPRLPERLRVREEARAAVVPQ